MSAEEKASKPVDGKQIILIVGVITIALGLFVMSRPKHRTISIANPPVKKETKKTPVAAVPSAPTSAPSDDGIISFEMYPAPKKTRAGADSGSSRDARVRYLLEGVSGIEDDLEAKNALITGISSLNFKLTGAEFLSVLAQASIEDDFYYTSAVKSVATSLQYPLTKAEFDGILDGVADVSHEFKLRTILGREQERNALP